MGWFNYGNKHKIKAQDGSISLLKSKKIQSIIINFNKSEIEERANKKPHACEEHREEESQTWIRIKHTDLKLIKSSKSWLTLIKSRGLIMQNHSYTQNIVQKK